MPRLRCSGAAAGNTRPWFWSRGANVEVRTEEEGFRGAWFPAKILKPPPPTAANLSTWSRKRKSRMNSNTVLVQYDHYVTEEDPNKPLTELAILLNVRPPPPPELSWKVFEVADDVDAFHNGAWWPGVVMSVEVGERYKVGFEDPPDLLVVGRSEVRCHLDWVNQIWSRPVKSKPMKNLIYNRESPVEVRLVKEHLWSAWIPAIYVGPLGGNLFLVQYKSPNISDKDGIATVVVADHQIRPRPPQHEDKDFYLQDMVDAFHDMSWWVGTITEVLTNKKYMVTFKLTKEQKEFSNLDLRLHLEWINKKWESDFSKFQSPVQDNEQTQHASTISRNSALATPRKCSSASKDSTREESEQLGPCTDKSAYRKTRNELRLPNELDDDATLLSPTPLKRLKRHSEESVSVDKTNVRRAPTNISTEKGLEKTGSLLGELGIEAASTVRKCDGKMANNKQIQMDKGDEDCIGNEHVMNKTESFGIQADSEVMRRSLGGNSGLLLMKESNPPDGNGLSSSTKAKGSESSTRNGTTEASRMEIQATWPDFSAKPAAHDQPVSSHPDEMPSDYTMKCSVNQVDEMHQQDDEMYSEGTTSCPGNLAATTKQQILVPEDGLPGKTPTHDQPLLLCWDEMHTENTIESSCSEDLTAGGRDAEVAATKIQENGAEISPKMTTQERPSIIFIDEMDYEDTRQGSGKSAENANQLNLVAVVETSANRPAHDQPLPLCIYKMHSEKTTKGSSSEDPAEDGQAEASAMEVEVAGVGISAKTHLHDQPLLLCGVDSENTLEGSGNDTETANRQNEVTGRQDEAGMSGEIEGEQTPHLPFEKKSPFWKMLESMDAFKRFPQQPHFKPLQMVKMICREGLAFGGMLIFSAVVEYTSKLQVDDPSDLINDILEALVELERLGFDIKALKDRLNDLQDMKLKFAQIKSQSNGVKIHITNSRHERSKMDAEMTDLEEKLRVIQAEREKMVAEMAAKDCEISMLESEENAIDGNIQSIKHNFQTLASAW